MATTIHHSTIKSAEKQGISLTVDGSIIRAFIPATGTVVYGVSGNDAVKQAIAARQLFEASGEVYRYRHGDDPKTIGRIEDTQQFLLSVETTTPVNFQKMASIAFAPTDDEFPASVVASVATIEETLDPPADADTAFVEDAHPKDPPVDATPVIKRNADGVALDGAIAYREGVTAADCPYSSEGEDDDDDEEYENFLRWNDEWDAAADEAEEEEGKDGGSVVASKYRTKYKEEGHPNHCGDWLANLLNNYCVGDKNTDLVAFEQICSMNGVDTGKYKREGVGWQGRIRMTGRNLLAKRVFQTGKIIVPELDGGATMEIAAPADWLSAQRYSKPEKAQ